jgi:hypothetical protein
VEALRKILDQKAQVAAQYRIRISRQYDHQHLRRSAAPAGESESAEGQRRGEGLTQRYTQQLSDQETRLDKLRNEKEDFEKKGAAAQEQLDTMIQDLAMEVTL